MSADSAANASVSQTTDTNQSDGDDSVNLTPIDADARASVMQKLGIPQAIRSRIDQDFNDNDDGPADKQSETVTDDNAQENQVDDPIEGEGETQTPDTDDDQVATEDEDEEEETAAPQGNEDLDALQRRNYKLRQKKRELTTRAEKAEQEAQALRAQLENAAPVTVAPSLTDPLSHVTDQASLETARTEFRMLRDMARTKPDGWIANEGKDNEVVITREQAAQYQSYAEDVLSDHFPRKEKEITQIRPMSRQASARILPTMFKTGTEDHQAAQLLWKQYPMLASNPERDYLTAIFLRGFKTVATEMSQKNGNGKTDPKLKIPDQILAAREARDKTPIQRATPPGRPSSGVVKPQSEKLGNAVKRMQQTGGSRESLISGILALGATRTNGKQPAPV